MASIQNSQILSSVDGFQCSSAGAAKNTNYKFGKQSIAVPSGSIPSFDTLKPKSFQASSSGVGVTYK